MGISHWEALRSGTRPTTSSAMKVASLCTPICNSKEDFHECVPHSLSDRENHENDTWDRWQARATWKKDKVLSVILEPIAFFKETRNGINQELNRSGEV